MNNILGIAFAVSTTVLLGSCAPHSEHSSERRNVVLISVDTLRADHMSLYGYERKTSPNLDRFFAERTVFQNAMSSSPCTRPSVLQFLTGQFETRRDNPRLAEVLKESGLATAAFTEQEAFGSQKAAYDRGFESFRNLSDERRGARAISDLAIDWLNGDQASKPYFLWLHYYAPHDPYNPPEQFRKFDIYETDHEDGDRDRTLKHDKRHDDSPTPIPELKHLELGSSWKTFGNRFSSTEIENFVALYDGEILYMDHEVGRVLAELERLEQLENSLVIFTSDHGEWLGENGVWDHCMSLHQREIHVPLMVSAPGDGLIERVPDKRPISTLDIFPTVLDWLGIEFDATSLSGTSMLRLGESPAVMAFWKKQRILRQGDWKLYYAEEPTGLFQVSLDPGEEHNRISTDLDSHQELVRRVERHDKLGNLMETESLEIIRPLRAIGYLQ
jgi:arylsulfatase A-like enzyme